jgi:hypothetical protein
MSILRGIFGHSKEEIWKQLSYKIGANYVDGGWFGRDKVIAQHKHWKITLDAKEGKNALIPASAPLLSTKTALGLTSTALTFLAILGLVCLA